MKRIATPQLKTGADKRDETYRASRSLCKFIASAACRANYVHTFSGIVIVVIITSSSSVSRDSKQRKSTRIPYKTIPHSFPARRPLERLCSDLTTRVQRSDDASASTARHWLSLKFAGKRYRELSGGRSETASSSWRGEGII